MKSKYDLFGWFDGIAQDGDVDRVTEVAPGVIPAVRVPGELYPNWSGHEWLGLPYVEPTPSPEPEIMETEWAWLIDLGPFSDRLGPAAVAIDLSTAPGLVAIRSDFARRKWIDLKDPRVIAAVHYLAGQPHPALGTLAQALITDEVASAVLNTLPAPAENLALRKLYFS